MASFVPGTTLPGGFVVSRCADIPELCATGVLLRHAATGACALHVAKADERNCAFAAGFRTQPGDSAGTPHVLEHVALCGSARFPTRDPFFKMLDRALSTYMNAWTASDWTLYVFSTQSAAAYAALSDVYLDAAFAPLLKETDVAQEAWRLERRKREDAHKSDADQSETRSADWALTGVVYNEMKGALSTPGARFRARLRREMLPGTTYAHESGGEPAEMPRLLTHAGVSALHRAAYRPGRSLLFSYGSLDLAAHLQRLDAALLDAQGRMGESSDAESVTLPDEGFAPFTEPRRIVFEGPVDAGADPERQVRAAVAFGTGTTRDADESLALDVLCDLLTDGAGAPLHAALVETNIGSGYVPGTGYASHYARPYMAVGLEGLRDCDVSRVEAAVYEAIAEALESPTVFSSERVDAALRRAELSLKAHRAGAGVDAAAAAVQAWAHGACPLDALCAGARLSRLRQRYAAEGPSLFTALVSKYLSVSNPHRLTLVMRPAGDLAAREAAEERALVCTLVSGMDAAALAALDRRNAELAALQTPAASAAGRETLPCLSLGDVSPDGQKDPFVCRADLPALPQLYERKTAQASDVVYVRARVPLSECDSDADLLLLPGLVACLQEIGTSDMDPAAFEDALRAVCSGVGASLVNATPAGPALHVHTHGLRPDVPRMLALLALALGRARWGDAGRVRAALASAAARALRRVASSGHSVARALAASGLSSHARVSELLSGLSQVVALNRLSALADARTLSDIQGVLSSSGSEPAKDGESAEASSSDCDAPALGSLVVAEVLRRLATRILSSQAARTATAYALVHSGVDAPSVVGALGAFHAGAFLPMEQSKPLARGSIAARDAEDAHAKFERVSLSDDDASLDSGVADKALGHGLKGPANKQSDAPSLTSDTAHIIEQASEMLESALGTVESVPAQLAIATPFGTSFAACALQTDASDVALAASLAVSARMLPSKHLHRVIREIGGAYGGGCVFSPYDGVFSFYSFRDPAPASSVDAFGQAPAWLAAEIGAGRISAQDLLEAKLPVFSDLDAPEDLEVDGLHVFSLGYSDARRQAFRDALFSVSLDDVRAACLLLADALAQNGAGRVSAPRTVVLVQDGRADVIDELVARRGFALHSAFAGLCSVPLRTVSES